MLRQLLIQFFNMKNILLSKLGNEIADISIDLSEQLEKVKKNSIANQIIRAGTSVGANISESEEAESIQDFIHKISIANKELSEFEYWIKLCCRKNLIKNDPELLDKINHLQKIIAKLKFTSKIEMERRNKLKDLLKKNKKK